jgi:hypothetical protein
MADRFFEKNTKTLIKRSKISQNPQKTIKKLSKNTNEIELIKKTPLKSARFR